MVIGREKGRAVQIDAAYGEARIQMQTVVD